MSSEDLTTELIGDAPLAAELEPGLLPVFRLIIGVYLGFVVAGTIASVLFGDRPLYTGNLWIITWMALLLGYLSWDGLQVRLGRAYLLIGLAIATLAPLVERAFLLNKLHEYAGPAEIGYLIMGTGWQLVLVLFLPLMLIAWQYRLRDVVVFCFGTTIIELILIRLIWNPGQDEALAAGAMAVSRLLIFLVIGYVITRMVNAQRAQRRKLSEANDRLTHYAATAEQLAISHERNRLARELHDTLAHTLSSLTVQLEAVDSVWDVASDQAHELLAKSRANARSGLIETRRALQALRASPLEDLGLVLAIRNLAETAAARGGFALQADLCDEVDGLTPAVEQGVYRIAQEALANVVKHAGAQTVTVALHQTDETILLQIEDDGQGFDAVAQLSGAGDDADDHYGLRGAYERAEMIGGEVFIMSKPGEGTVIRLQAPVG